MDWAVKSRVRLLLFIHYVRAVRQTGWMPADRLAELLLFHCADADRELKFT